MEKVVNYIYDVFLLHKNNKFVELLVCEEEGQSILIVDINLENNCIFRYITCSNYTYGNRETYDEAINKAIKKIKKGEEK